MGSGAQTGSRSKLNSGTQLHVVRLEAYTNGFGKRVGWPIGDVSHLSLIYGNGHGVTLICDYVCRPL